MPPSSPLSHCFHGTLIDSKTLGSITTLSDTLLVTNETGAISHILPNVAKDDVPARLKDLCTPAPPVTYLRRTQFIIPGFIDTHNHAPQWAQRGLGHNKPLLEWLDHVTFPHEAKFEDVQYAKRMYKQCVRGLLIQGTTTVSYYGSRHGAASRILADVCEAEGQRAFVGKCNMNREAPDWYRDDSAEESLKDTKKFLEYFESTPATTSDKIDGAARKKPWDPKESLVTPIITPRFAVTCDHECLSGLGEMAKAHPHFPIQTHFDESKDEMSYTKVLYPNFSNQADLYEHYGLLNHRTILAHSIFVEEHEKQRLAALGCGVSHCPISNITMGTFAIAPIRDYLRRGIKVGLGTDIGAGYASSILTNVRQAFVVSTAQNTNTQGRDPILTVAECFYLATLGGAQVMGLDDRIGTLDIGKDMDVLVIDTTNEDDEGGVKGNIMTPIEEENSIQDILEKFLMTGDDRNIVEVYVRGRKVKGGDV